MNAREQFNATLGWLQMQPGTHAALARDQLCQLENLREALTDRDDEVRQLRQQNTDLLVLMKSVGAVLDVVGRAARQEVQSSEVIEAAVDNTSFKNLMSTMYGLDSLGAPLPPKRTRKAKA